MQQLSYSHFSLPPTSQRDHFSHFIFYGIDVKHIQMKKTNEKNGKEKEFNRYVLNRFLRLFFTRSFFDFRMCKKVMYNHLISCVYLYVCARAIDRHVETCSVCIVFMGYDFCLSAQFRFHSTHFYSL